MPTKEIPFSEWVTYFDQFSRQHEGWREVPKIDADDCHISASSCSYLR